MAAYFNTMDKHRFPQYLSAPFQVLWFESDEVGIILLFFMISSVFGAWTWILLILGPCLYSKAKKKYPKGFLRHMLYFTGLKELKHCPNFFDNFFVE